MTSWWRKADAPATTPGRRQHSRQNDARRLRALAGAGGAGARAEGGDVLGLLRSSGTEKVMPVCLVPRVIAATEWTALERGLVQRLTALQLFLDDLYGEQKVLADRVIPAELVLASRQYVPRLRGLKPPGGVRIHIAGVDPIRSPDGVLRVLEDNLRTPSGVSSPDREPPGDEADVPDRARSPGRPPRRRLPDPAGRHAALGVARRSGEVDGGRADASARSTRPTSSTASWRARWASSWSKRPTCS